MNKITFPDPFRPNITITLSGWVEQNEDGSWDAHFAEDNPGYGTSLPSSTHKSKKQAEKWVRDQVRERLRRAERTKRKLETPTEYVDLSGIR